MCKTGFTWGFVGLLVESFELVDLFFKCGCSVKSFKTVSMIFQELSRIGGMGRGVFCVQLLRPHWNASGAVDAVS